MDAPDPYTDDDEMVSWWGLVLEGYHATTDHILSRINEQFGLPAASFDILLRLLRSPGNRMPMTRLATEAALSSGGFTKVADRLAKADLIRREPSATDRRVTFAALTDHGLEIAKQSRSVCAEVLRERVLTPLGRVEAETLANAMRKLRSVNRPDGDPIE